jgi:hypothetical protein
VEEALIFQLARNGRRINKNRKPASEPFQWLRRQRIIREEALQPKASSSRTVMAAPSQQTISHL